MIIAYIAGVNIIAFLIMGMDKQKAKTETYRIPERTLWGLAILGGAIGVWAGMKSFRHKTRHRSFVIGMPVLIIIQAVFVVSLF
ncbi:hypothetical protein GCM10007063_03880 [Lentibacillus kapialis]|uniref:DUF1294 domain-containing protein n=1 Tax=Lentibacillus kapialis TaxID=340214 RepID=A0A917UTL9_9BACI|nr:DUF1294 domain-containing protein [Lentibacillus kapialis]GGJ84588.1 hypothetical protein GCM10007063_03880 [Lentibacillus kapialis]